MDWDTREIDYVYDPRHPLRLQHEIQTFEKLFNIESEFMAARGYSNNIDNIMLRRISVSIIQQISLEYGEFDAFVPYIAMNYFDRFLSRNRQIIPMEQNSANLEHLKIFAICCLSIAGKMRTKSFSLVELLIKNKVNTSLQLISSIELQILDSLKWRMRSLTAICFMEFFLPFFTLRYPQPIQGFTRRDICQIIITAQGNIKFTEFRPSIIAACAILDACSKVLPDQFLLFMQAVLSCPRVRNVDLLQCMEALGIEYKGNKIEELVIKPEPIKEFTLRELLDEELKKEIGESEPYQPRPEIKSKGKEKVEGGEEPEPGTGRPLSLREVLDEELKKEISEPEPRQPQQEIKSIGKEKVDEGEEPEPGTDKPLSLQKWYEAYMVIKDKAKGKAFSMGELDEEYMVVKDQAFSMGKLDEEYMVVMDQEYMVVMDQAFSMRKLDEEYMVVKDKGKGQAFSMGKLDEEYMAINDKGKGIMKEQESEVMNFELNWPQDKTALDLLRLPSENEEGAGASRLQTETNELEVTALDLLRLVSEIDEVEEDDEEKEQEEEEEEVERMEEELVKRCMGKRCCSLL